MTSRPTEGRSPARARIRAVLLGGLVPLAGALVGALAVVGIAVGGPDLVLTAGFRRTSAVVAVLLNGCLAFAGARLAARSLRREGAYGHIVPVAFAGPVAAVFVTQFGSAVNGAAVTAAAAVAAAAAGALIGAARAAGRRH